MIKLDILAFGAHPDDVELGAGGTLLKEIKRGKKAGIVDLTRGEMGTRGTPGQRDSEAEASSALLNLSVRTNLKFRDGFLVNDEKHQLEIIRLIRLYQPEIVLCNAIDDRHPDHGLASELVSKACFLSGLRRIETTIDNKMQDAWRPKAVYHYIQDRYISPHFVIDITEQVEEKMNVVRAFKSQFFNPDSDEPETAISSADFFDFLYGRAAEFGRPAGFKYAEGFTTERFPGADSLFDLR